MEPLHDVNSAAKLLAISPWTVRAYIREGKLHPVRIGRLVRLTTEELERFIQDSAGTFSCTNPGVLQINAEQQIPPGFQFFAFPLLIDSSLRHA
jgi:excisionase family DNA binding protein